MNFDLFSYCSEIIRKVRRIAKKWYVGKEIKRIETGLTRREEYGLEFIGFTQYERHWTSRVVHSIADTSYRAKRFISKNWEFCIQTCVGITAIAVAIVLSWK